MEILNDFDTLNTIILPRFVGNGKCKLLCFSGVMPLPFIFWLKLTENQTSNSRSEN